MFRLLIKLNRDITQRVPLYRTKKQIFYMRYLVLDVHKPVC
jgi:hypothetical protein